MGTRHLIAVKLDGEYKIAQYGQWDGYPSGQGSSILDFLRDDFDRPLFETKLRAASFVRDDEIEHFNSVFRSLTESEFKQQYYQFSRDAGADILWIVQDSPSGIRLKNEIAFAADSLFCEYAYVIDLDLNNLEVFKGFNKQPLKETERFAHMSPEHPEYFPIRQVAVYPLSSLPTVEQMIAACDPPEPEDD